MHGDAAPWLQPPMDFSSLIARKRDRFAELEREIADPGLFSNRKRAQELMRERAGIEQLLTKWDELESARKQLDDNRELSMSRDVEIAAMADDEIPDLEKRVADLERSVQIALLPADETEERDAIIEIRAGTGGNEAAIFAADLYRMYNRYAETAGLNSAVDGSEIRTPLRAGMMLVQPSLAGPSRRVRREVG